METEFTNGSISVQTRQCLRSLVDLTNHCADQVRKAWFDFQRASLSIWADHLGVFARGHASVEHRLLEHGKLYSLFSNLLVGMENDLQACHEVLGKGVDESLEASINKKYLNDLFVRVEGDIERLSCLAALVKAWGNAEREQRAALYDPQDARGRSLIDAWRGHTIVMLDQRLMKTSCDSYLRERLLRTMELRWRRLIYNSHREKRLQHRLELTDAQDEVNTSTAKSNAKNATTASRGVSSASRLSGSKHLDRAPRAPRSLAATAWTHLSAHHLDFPSQPNSLRGSDVFRCPFCQALKSSGHEEHWRIHVMHDLRPYICIYPDCKSAESTFRDYLAWTQHLESDHFPVSWKCRDCSMMLTSESNFRQHLLQHSPSSTEHELAVAAVCAASTCLKNNSCPFCAKAFDDIDKMYAHVGGDHLKGFALESIPWELVDWVDFDSNASSESSSRSLDQALTQEVGTEAQSSNEAITDASGETTLALTMENLALRQDRSSVLSPNVADWIMSEVDPDLSGSDFGLLSEEQHSTMRRSSLGALDSSRDAPSMTSVPQATQHRNAMPALVEAYLNTLGDANLLKEQLQEELPISHADRLQERERRSDQELPVQSREELELELTEERQAVERALKEANERAGELSDLLLKHGVDPDPSRYGQQSDSGSSVAQSQKLVETWLDQLDFDTPSNQNDVEDGNTLG